MIMANCLTIYENNENRYSYQVVNILPFMKYSFVYCILNTVFYQLFRNINVYNICIFRKLIYELCFRNKKYNTILYIYG